ncbi:MAG TPA: DUF4924 domain-containing protein, partial [Porphyromonadaceae bacterium]|nr:DUF4924 domain-containing protein [Porphyromonadaceae bacterium]
MWQIEDILRGFHFNMQEIEKNIISRFSLPDEKKEKVREWYFSLVQSMQEEGITQHGHLKMVQETLNKLVEIHTHLLKEGKDTPYIEAFQKALPHIVSIRASAKENAKGEIETCFEELYGILLLHLKHKEITSQTQ